VIEEWEEYRTFERELKKFLDSVQAERHIREALIYALSAGGKRTRPLVVLVSGKMCGGNLQELMNLAISVELIHTASLVHDDVIDKAEKRRNRKTIHKQYDLPLAIVLGDWLISKSVELTSYYGEEIIRKSARLGMMMSEGESLDFYSVKEKFDESDYFECITKKTAAIFAHSAWSACRAVCDDLQAAEKLYEYGMNLGLAYQLVDDLLEYLRAYEDKLSLFESRTLPQIYEESYGKEEAVNKILDLIGLHTHKSLSALEYFEDGEEKKKLQQIVKYMTYEMLRKRGVTIEQKVTF
jgi:octaprenyl-diphosphate synthase